MNRKILKSSKSKRMSGYAKGRIWTVLGIQDRNSEPLFVGDKVRYGDYIGRILYNPAFDSYDVMPDYSMWYGTNEFDVKSYGKCVSVPMDNGAKLDLELLCR